MGKDSNNEERETKHLHDDSIIVESKELDVVAFDVVKRLYDQTFRDLVDR